MSVRLHVGVVRMSEQILQPPHCSVQGVERLVKDQSAQLGDRALVGRVGQHLQLNISYKYFEIFITTHLIDSQTELLLSHFCPGHRETNIGLHSLLHIDQLITVDGNLGQRTGSSPPTLTAIFTPTSGVLWQIVSW